MDYKTFYNYFKSNPKNKVNIIPFSIDEFNNAANIIVITKKFNTLHTKIFNKTVLFINPDYDYIDRFIMNYDTALGIFIEEIPLYAKGFIQYKKKRFGYFIVVNPIYKYSNDIWTIHTWYSSFIGELNHKTHVKLNDKPLTSTMTMCDLFFVTDNPTNLNIPVNISNMDDFTEIDNNCDKCIYRNICRYKYLQSYRNVYPSCEDYIEIELNNLNRLVYLYNKTNITKDMLDKKYTVCSIDVKEKIYGAFI